VVPIHVLPHQFDACLPQLLRVRNLGGLVFTIPYTARACTPADDLLAQARVVGAINVLGHGKDGRWRGEILDGLGCVAALRRRGVELAGKRVLLIGAGGAGSAIAVSHRLRAAGVVAHTISTRIAHARWWRKSRTPIRAST
jgi:shikimate dehydrogenase